MTTFEQQWDQTIDVDDVLEAIMTLGCMYHKDEGKCPVFPSPRYWMVSGGDIWCDNGLQQFRAEGNSVRARRVQNM